MIVYYGVKRKIKIDKKLGNITCPNCGHFVEYALAHEGGYAHVYGIPIFPVLGGWKIKLCPICGIMEKVSNDEFKRIKKS